MLAQAAAASASRAIAAPSSVTRAVGVERAELAQQRARLRHRRARRRIEESERVRGSRDAPDGEIEREAGEVGRQDLRRREGLEAAGRRRLPQAIADAGLDAAGAPAPLVGVARETRTVSSRVRPRSGSKSGTRMKPQSMTTRTPSMVSEVSAIEVASTILRRPGARRRDGAVLRARSSAP